MYNEARYLHVLAQSWNQALRTKSSFRRTLGRNPWFLVPEKYMYILWCRSSIYSQRLTPQCADSIEPTSKNTPK